MPYKIKGNCIYKKNAGKKVGCTKGPVKKYMAALQANVKESLNESYELKNTVLTDGGHEATVFFTLTKVPGAELGLVFDMSNADLPPDYTQGVIRDSTARQMHPFTDANEAADLLSNYGLEPQDVENEMYQQAIEEIQNKQTASKIDDGVRIESLKFEILCTKILNS
jgi:hypothetical protein